VLLFRMTLPPPAHSHEVPSARPLTPTFFHPYVFVPVSFFVTSKHPCLITSLFPLSPFPATLPKKSSITPFIATLPKSLDLNSFACHTSAKRGGVPTNVLLDPQGNVPVRRVIFSRRLVWLHNRQETSYPHWLRTPKSYSLHFYSRITAPGTRITRILFIGL
jgi:hypothetical protein